MSPICFLEMYLNRFEYSRDISRNTIGQKYEFAGPYQNSYLSTTGSTAIPLLIAGPDTAAGV